MFDINHVQEIMFTLAPYKDVSGKNKKMKQSSIYITVAQVKKCVWRLVVHYVNVSCMSNIEIKLWTNIHNKKYFQIILIQFNSTIHNGNLI